jgi:hypothetical protein
VEIQPLADWHRRTKAQIVQPEWPLATEQRMVEDLAREHAESDLFGVRRTVGEQRREHHKPHHEAGGDFGPLQSGNRLPPFSAGSRQDDDRTRLRCNPVGSGPCHA